MASSSSPETKSIMVLLNNMLFKPMSGFIKATPAKVSGSGMMPPGRPIRKRQSTDEFLDTGDGLHGGIVACGGFPEDVINPATVRWSEANDPNVPRASYGATDLHSDVGQYGNYGTTSRGAEVSHGVTAASYGGLWADAFNNERPYGAEAEVYGAPGAVGGAVGGAPGVVGGAAGGAPGVVGGAAGGKFLCHLCGQLACTCYSESDDEELQLEALHSFKKASALNHSVLKSFGRGVEEFTAALGSVRLSSESSQDGLDLTTQDMEMLKCLPTETFTAIGDLVKDLPDDKKIMERKRLLVEVVNYFSAYAKRGDHNNNYGFPGNPTPHFSMGYGNTISVGHNLGSDSRVKAIYGMGYGQGMRPVGEGMRPVGEGMRPVGEGMRPVGEGMRPVGEGMRPVGEGMRPGGEGMRPGGEGMRPIGEGMRPIGGGMRSLGGGMRSLGGGMRPFGEGMRSVGAGMRPVGEGMRPVGEGMRPGGEGMRPVGEGMRPIGTRKPYKSETALIACAFCKRNNESKTFCESHSLKDRNGKVTCPILFKYVCEQCGATGPDAHTISYCPLSQNAPGMGALYKSKHNSAGKRRSLRK